MDAAAFQELLVEVVKYQKRVMAPMWGGGIGFKRSPLPATSGYEASLWPKGFEATRVSVVISRCFCFIDTCSLVGIATPIWAIKFLLLSTPIVRETQDRGTLHCIIHTNLPHCNWHCISLGDEIGLMAVFAWTFWINAHHRMTNTESVCTVPVVPHPCVLQRRWFKQVKSHWWNT